MTKTAAVVAVLAMAALGAPSHADEWDQGTDTDNSLATDNSLFHGAEQVHDLAARAGGVPDEDWFLVSARPFSSYQVEVDGWTGDLDFSGGSIQLVDDAGNVVGSGTVTDSGRQITINETRGAGGADRYVRVQGQACEDACTSQARYRIRFYDTTYTVPRFNNSGTQATVLLVLNASDRSCTVRYEFFRNDGSPFFEADSVTLVPAQLHVFALASHPALAGTSGSVRVHHTCGYGGLSGKAVSLEPATGFTFETPLVPRPH